MKMVKTLFMCLIVVIINIAAFAQDTTVGAPGGGWDESTDLTAWVSKQTFWIGEKLIFNYTEKYDVVEVSEENFESCNATNPLQPPQTSGYTVVLLNTYGTRYFICTNFCGVGMKVEINAYDPPSEEEPEPETPEPEESN